MIQIKALAQEIEDELNGNLTAVANEVKFKIHANVGNYQRATKTNAGATQRYVNGVLRSASGTYTPVKDLNNLTVSLMLELAVQQDKTEVLEEIMSSWSESVIGEIFTMGDWKLLITPEPTTVGTAKDTSPMGAMIPFLCVLQIQFIKDGLISNAVTWKINDNVIAVDNVTRSNVRTTDTVPKANNGVCVVNNQYENETITMIIPVSFSTIVQTLLNDIQAHNIDKKYHIVRQDNFSNDLDGYYLLTTAETSEESGKIVSITASFKPADTTIY